MNKNTLIKISITIITSVILFIFPFIPNAFDSFLTSNFNVITGEREPDSSIVIIHISAQDIEQLGPWPIKRSYYALLIKNLSSLNVKKIGLEVFLSAKFVSQAVYDNVLQKEIERAGNVVLSSIAGSLNESDKFYSTDSLSYPSPRLINENFSTGHINYIQKNGIEIPLQIFSQLAKEQAFSLSLIDSITDYPERIKINFIASYNKFKNFTLIEFFQMVQENDSELKELENKIILVGISDPQLSSVFQTNFDEELPGVAMHAFALDNLLNSRSIRDEYYSWSIYFFILIVLLFILNTKNKKSLLSFYIIIFSISLLTYYLLFRLFYFELAYSYLFIPMIFVFISDIYMIIVENRNQMRGYFNEAELFKKLLSEKEQELSLLQKDLDKSSKQKSEQLLGKIEDLKDDIKKLKENENDQIAANIQATISEQNFYGLVFRSKELNNVVDIIKKSAPTDASVLITGESGTGKELAARAVHLLSERKDGKFVAVNCAALTESLLESELFGHVKGAFTGAVTDKIGKFEAANGGTIFLDEIGETSENFQVKLLRVLQSGEYDKVGSVKSEFTDARVISATNKDLNILIKEKKFREDLFYRLNVININIPPLRERKEDVESIARYFCDSDKKKYHLSLASLKTLIDYDWPGNVRELESVIKRAKVFCEAEKRTLIQLNDLPVGIVKNVKLNFEDLVIDSLRVKKFSHSSINETAKELGNVSRTLVAENFRGYSLKLFVENNFDEVKTVAAISDSSDEEILNRVKSKLDIWISNIRKDVEPFSELNFEEIKVKLNSKYKNLPQKFHYYLDEVIMKLLIKS
ncbi:MAG: sigma 54-interacting transcriptional regulator [Ignavibacterium sp.]|nr:sigma 54-interacting transcriptional regulator [Ignavibacterium sp.]